MVGHYISEQLCWIISWRIQFLSYGGGWILNDYALCAVVLMLCVTKVAKAALDKALAETEDGESIRGSSSVSPMVSESPVHINQPLIIKVDPPEENNQK